jgi:DNA-binding response OmpR family regulator
VYHQGRALLDAIAEEKFDCYLLDWNLPDISGLDVMSLMRTKHQVRAPVLFATGRDNEEDVVAALNAGADDFMVKPIRHAELIARVQALLRRHGVLIAENTIRIGQHEIDPLQHEARYQGRVVSLTDTEFALALYLMRNVGVLTSRAKLYGSALGKPEGMEQLSRTVDIHLGNLRKKFFLDESTGLCIRSVYRVGYRLEEVAVAADPDSQ